MSKMTDDECFKALGMSPSASLAEARKAYRRLAMRYHPDRNPSSEAEGKFKTISTAFTQLEVSFKNGCLGDGPREKPRHAQPKAETRNERPTAQASSKRPSGWFRFEAKSTTIMELSQTFFAQYVEKGTVAARSGKPFQEDARDMAHGLMSLFERFSIKKAHLDIFSVDFAKEMWRREDPQLVAVLFAASDICRREHSDLAGDAVSPGIILVHVPSMLSKENFYCLHEISAPNRSGNTPAKEEFHRWAARHFRGPMSTCEAYEAKREPIVLRLDRRPFAQRLIHNRPELLPIYAKEGWFDWSHESYERREVNIVEEIANCASLAWGQIADVLWAGFSPAACAQAINDLQSLAAAKAIAGHLEQRILAAGIEDAVSLDRQSPGMSLERRAKEKMEKTLMELRSGFFDAWRDRSASLGKRSLKAWANGKKEALESALADAERQGASLGSLKWDGVSLAALASWMNFFKHAHAPVAALALERMSSADGGAATMERADEFGLSAQRWAKRAAAKKEADGSCFKNDDFQDSGSFGGFAEHDNFEYDNVGKKKRFRG